MITIAQIVTMTIHMRRISRCVYTAMMILLFTCHASYGSTSWNELRKNIRFRHLDISQLERLHGKQGQINAIVQDEYGFIWMSSDLGLLRYDGHEFRSYPYDPSENGLIAKVINDLHIDAKGRIWIASTSGLSLYRQSSDDFKNYIHAPSLPNSLSHQNVFSVTSDNRGRILLGTEGGINILDPTTDHITSISLTNEEKLDSPLKEVFHITVDTYRKENTYAWLSTRNGIYEINLDTLRVSNHYLDGENIHVHRSMVDSYGNVWVGTFGQGLIQLKRNGEHHFFKKIVDDSSSLGSNTVRDLLQDSNQNLWVALDHGGLNLFDYSTNTFVRYKKSPGSIGSISSDQLRCLFEDNEQNLWVGTYFGGVNIVAPHNNAIVNIVREPKKKQTLLHNGLLRIFEDRKHNIWIGSEGGLNKMNDNLDIIESYSHDEKQSNTLSANPVLAINEDHDGYLWIGTWSGGLQKFDPKTGIFSLNYLTSEKYQNTINSNYVWDIEFDKNNNVWIGTETGGINRLDFLTKQFTFFENLSSHTNDDETTTIIVAMKKDSQDNIWIASLNGLFRLNPITQEFVQVGEEGSESHQLSSQRTVAFMEHSNGSFWVATQDGGINILNISDKTNKHLDTDDGLPSRSIVGLIEDDFGYVWATTLNGIVKIDANDNFKMYTLKEQNGIAGNQFNREAITKDHQGRLYFGGISGLTVIDPTKLDFKKNDRSVVLTELYVQYDQVRAMSNSSPLQKPLYQTDKITLSHQQNAFSFHFSAQNYASPTISEYQYRLVGYDRRWVNSGIKNFSNYTNMNAGNYRFEVRTNNSFGGWSDTISAVDVHILPPPWFSLWAKIIYGILFLLICYLFTVFLNLRLRTRLYLEMSTKDTLTKVLNRHGLSPHIDKFLTQKKNTQKLSVMVIDVDDFKAINDTYGHDIGDHALIFIANTLKSNIRIDDQIARWGGEEFLVLAETSSKESTLILAEKLRKSVENNTLCIGENSFKFTISIGISFRHNHDHFDELFKRADQALYAAKTSGKNIVKTEGDT